MATRNEHENRDGRVIKVSISRTAFLERTRSGRWFKDPG